MGSGGNGMSRSGAGPESPKTHRQHPCFAFKQALGRHPQSVFDPVLGPTSSAPQHFSSTNFIVRTQAQPRGEMASTGKTTPVIAQFRKECMDCEHADSRHTGQIHAKETVEFVPPRSGGCVLGDRLLAADLARAG